MAAIASRYARALVEVVLEQKIDPDVARQQLNAFVDAVTGSDDLRRVWESPAVPTDQKHRLVDALARKIGAARPVRNFMAILIDHRRIPMLAEIARQFAVELDAKLGFVEAEISSARQLSADEKREIETRIEHMTGKKVRASYKSSPELLGGAMVRVGSTIYDGSVRGQLESIKQELVTA